MRCKIKGLKEFEVTTFTLQQDPENPEYVYQDRPVDLVFDVPPTRDLSSLEGKTSVEILFIDEIDSGKVRCWRFFRCTLKSVLMCDGNTTLTFLLSKNSKGLLSDVTDT